MSEPTSIEGGARARPGPEAAGWKVRPATGDDVGAIAGAIERLLVELGGGRPPRAELEAEIEAVLDDPGVGALIVAEAAGEVVGVLSASWQRALHVPGRYATIQDLWTHPGWRGRRVGAGLVGETADLRAEGVTRIEVGLPRESFDAILATEAFYLGNEFEHLGPRMRRLVR